MFKGKTIWPQCLLQCNSFFLHRLSNYTSQCIRHNYE